MGHGFKKRSGKYSGSIPSGKKAARGLIPQPPKQVPKGSTNHCKVLLSFELFDADAECPSTWQGDEVKSLFAMFLKACQRTWQQVIETGGRISGSGKVGLGWTEFRDDDPFTRPATLSADLCIAEMRVSQEARVFGSRKDECFYVIRLDRGHNVIKA